MTGPRTNALTPALRLRSLPLLAAVIVSGCGYAPGDPTKTEISDALKIKSRLNAELRRSEVEHLEKLTSILNHLGRYEGEGSLLSTAENDLDALQAKLLDLQSAEAKLKTEFETYKKNHRIR